MVIRTNPAEACSPSSAPLPLAGKAADSHLPTLTWGAQMAGVALPEQRPCGTSWGSPSAEATRTPSDGRIFRPIKFHWSRFTCPTRVGSTNPAGATGSAVGEGRMALHVPPVCPSSGESNGTRRDETGRSGGTIRCEIKALAGNSATCLGFCFRLVAGSIPAASTFLSRDYGWLVASATRVTSVLRAGARGRSRTLTASRRVSGLRWA